MRQHPPPGCLSKSDLVLSPHATHNLKVITPSLFLTVTPRLVPLTDSPHLKLGHGRIRQLAAVLPHTQKVTSPPLFHLLTATSVFKATKQTVLLPTLTSNSGTVSFGSLR